MPSKKKITAQVTAVQKIPQPHGGALNSGGTPGHRGGGGRPPNALRELLRADLETVYPVATEIARGAPVQRIEMPLAVLLKHVKCPRCDGKLQAVADDPSTVSVGVKVSAKQSDRIASLNFLAQYGLGAKDEITMVSPDVVDRIRRQVQVMLSRKVWKTDELVAQIGEVWK